ncbi:hypothetical protein [Staphylococcus pseudintermedius]|uniref:hypothetical protein n=1 Tax=Staphylococcus pseudintermedius TaxID=283734 RepID=UPI00286E9EDA|nr:hypothetical protein [Staphylococcus pseudintermedius]WMZ52627.1 hypothetical protein QS421_11820 [Staphylococcus pseudintermedius]
MIKVLLSTTREGASTFVSTVDSLKDKASNNGTASEFESVVKSSVWLIYHSI